MQFERTHRHGTNEGQWSVHKLPQCVCVCVRVCVCGPLYIKKGGHRKEPNEKDQQQGLVMAVSRGARLIKALDGMLRVRVDARKMEQSPFKIA